MNKVVALISRGVNRFNLSSGLAAKANAASSWSSLRSALREREPQVPKLYLLPARIVVVLAGLVIAVNGILLLAAGHAGSSWSLILSGSLMLPLSSGLIWLGLKPIRDGFCTFPVAFAAELLFRVVGYSA